MNRTELKIYIEEHYDAICDRPWPKYPEYEVMRHRNNSKWFALIMKIPASKLGIEDDRMVDIVNIKCDPDMIGSLLLEQSFYPAYHMNKDKWISILLDENTPQNMLIHLLELSFTATARPYRPTK